jgi:hypothetical protein
MPTKAKDIYLALLKRKYTYLVNSSRNTIYADFQKDGQRRVEFKTYYLTAMHDAFGLFMLRYGRIQND